MSEAHEALLNACMEVLAIRGLPIISANQRPVKTKKGWRHPGATPGCPDLISCLPPNGVMLLIDPKVGSDCASETQEALFAVFEKAGAIGLLVYDAVALDEWLVPRLAAESHAVRRSQ